MSIKAEIIRSRDDSFLCDGEIVDILGFVYGKNDFWAIVSSGDCTIEEININRLMIIPEEKE